MSEWRKKWSTGFSVQVNLTRLAAYIAIGVLSGFGELPWWALPVLVLYDYNWVARYHSPKRMALLKQLYIEQQADYMMNLARMPGTEVNN